jgi:hypothetical protein
LLDSATSLVATTATVPDKEGTKLEGAVTRVTKQNTTQPHLVPQRKKPANDKDNSIDRNWNPTRKNGNKN